MHETKRAVIDTNVLVYDLFEDSLYNTEASSLLDSLEEWVIPAIVVHELVWFIKGLKIETEKAYKLILQYLDNDKTVVKRISARHAKIALDMLLNEKLSLSRYNDKLILAVAIEEKAPIATFDEKLRRQAEKHGVGVVPPATSP
jgi:predicted nucleic acid-binding protein